jgi:hypothetical protein
MLVIVLLIALLITLHSAMDVNDDKIVTYEVRCVLILLLAADNLQSAKKFVAQQRMELWRVFCMMDENGDGKLDQEVRCLGLDRYSIESWTLLRKWSTPCMR